MLATVEETPGVFGDRDMKTDEHEDEVICPSCCGSGISPLSHRPDDFGPHYRCSPCQGTGVRSEQ